MKAIGRGYNPDESSIRGAAACKSYAPGGAENGIDRQYQPSSFIGGWPRPCTESLSGQSERSIRTNRIRRNARRRRFACLFFPARRTTHVQPLQALRSE